MASAREALCGYRLDYAENLFEKRSRVRARIGCSERGGDLQAIASLESQE